MKFGYTLLYVADVERSLTFYENAFSLKRKFFHEDGESQYGELETGATTLGFVSHALAGSHGFDFQPSQLADKPPAFEIGLVTDDVAAAYQTAVERGAVAVAAPQAKPWGQVVSYVRDPDGFLIEICSPVSN